MPIIAIWDDHDYGANDAGGDFPYRQQSAALFRSFWQVPDTSPRGQRDGLYDAFTFGPPGQRVQIIVLDLRSFRSSLKPTDERGAAGKERYLPDPDPAKTMLGEAQWTWLGERLREPADLRLLVSSIQVLPEGHGWERWGNLPLERERLLELIEASGAGGVVILSGDRHLGALYQRTAPGCLSSDRDYVQFVQPAVPRRPRAGPAAVGQPLHRGQLRNDRHRLAGAPPHARAAGRRRCIRFARRRWS